MLLGLDLALLAVELIAASAKACSKLVWLLCNLSEVTLVIFWSDPIDCSISLVAPGPP